MFSTHGSVYIFALLTCELVFERLYISRRVAVGDDIATDDGLWVIRQVGSRRRHSNPVHSSMSDGKRLSPADALLPIACVP